MPFLALAYLWIITVSVIYQTVIRVPFLGRFVIRVSEVALTISVLIYFAEGLRSVTFTYRNMFKFLRLNGLLFDTLLGRVQQGGDL